MNATAKTAAGKVAIDLGLKPGGLQKVGEELVKVLADSYLLYLKTQNFHWNVTGPASRNCIFYSKSSIRIWRWLSMNWPSASAPSACSHRQASFSSVNCPRSRKQLKFPPLKK